MKTGIVERELTRQYERYYRFALSIVRNREDALDVVQEAAYRAIRGQEKLQKPEFADTWIHKIILNTAMNLLRKKKQECPQEDSLLLDAVQPSVESGYEKSELESVLALLDPEDRTILVLRYFEDRKLEEIAEITGKKVNTVKTRLYRALDRLQEMCTEQGARKGVQG